MKIIRQTKKDNLRDIIRERKNMNLTWRAAAKEKEREYGFCFNSKLILSLRTFNIIKKITHITKTYINKYIYI